MLAEISHEPGTLHDVLSYFRRNDVSITHIESRPSQFQEDFIIYIDFIDNGNANKVIHELKKDNVCKNVLIVDPLEVPWFPKQISDLDKIANRVMMGGTDLQSDHPGFHDQVYKTRRSELTKISMNYRHGDPIPLIKYTNEEIYTWKYIFEKLEQSHSKNACREYNNIVSQMKSQIGYSAHSIPQLKDINDFLVSRTGFKIRPVAGLLSSRDFLNALAHRVFFSTPYIRHQSKPLYTPEPDIIHEIIGHAGMLSDPLFGEFSQQLGLASLGASVE
jgi:phenylalanine-4-hydroxylase